jgi:Ca-activated chloride channel family protein
VVSLADLNAFLSAAVSEWRSVRVAELLFAHREAARFAVVMFMAVSAAALIGRGMLGARAGRNRLALPAMLPVIRPSLFSFVRHSALLLFLAGLPFFILAFADPFTSLSHQEVSYPGRRIGLLIDASSSMMEPFKAAQLAADAPSDARFFTAVAAAETFVRMRMKSKYRDLIALIEFGDESYVITPFTNDYENILLSISLIDDLTEFNKFPDQGTTIGMAINQSVRLFTAFDFLNASGNLMVIFSDGEDTKVSGPRLGGLNVDQILSGATQAKIPVYFIRTSFNKVLGRAFTDPIWKPVVEKTGGRFYAASDEATILSAIREIDKVAVGKVAIRQYSTQQPRFSIFALVSVALWTLALTLKLTVPHLSKFP